VLAKDERKEVMKSKTQVIAFNLALLLLISVVAAPRTLAQHSHDHKGGSDWKTGMLRFSEPVWAGNDRLKSGMYHVKHVMDGNKHLIVFKPVTMPAGKGFPMWEEKEVVRLECQVEPVEKSTSNTKVRFGRNAAGERVIEEIQIAGEKFRHVLSGRAGQMNSGNW
jgi:hypothetical protein